MAVDLKLGCPCWKNPLCVVSVEIDQVVLSFVRSVISILKLVLFFLEFITVFFVFLIINTYFFVRLGISFK